MAKSDGIDNAVRVLVPVVDGFEEIEAITIIDILRRAGMDVVVASVESGTEWVTGSHQIPIKPDTHLESIWSETLVNQFDALAIPGGPGVKTLLDCDRVGQLARQFAKARKCTAAICAAPLVLSQAGLLTNRTATSFPATEADMNVGHYSQSRVVVDGHIITSRGAGTAIEFAIQLVAELISPIKAAEIAQSIVAMDSPKPLAMR